MLVSLCHTRLFPETQRQRARLEQRNARRESTERVRRLKPKTKNTSAHTTHAVHCVQCCLTLFKVALSHSLKPETTGLFAIGEMSSEKTVACSEVLSGGGGLGRKSKLGLWVGAGAGSSAHSYGNRRAASSSLSFQRGGRACRPLAWQLSLLTSAWHNALWLMECQSDGTLQ